MKLNHLVLLSLVVGLAACSKSEDKKKPSVEIPDQIQMGGPSGSGMTLEQKADLKTVFANALPVVIELAYQPKDESTEDARKRQDRLAKVTTTQKELISQIQSNCQISQPVSIQENPSSLTPGAQSKSQKTASMSGARCPVRQSNVSGATATIVDADVNQSGINLLTGTIQGSIEVESTVIDPVWIAKSNLVSLNLRGTMSGGLRFEKTSSREYIRASLDGYYESRAEGRVPMKGEFESLKKGNNGQSEERIVMIVNLLRPQGTAQLYQMTVKANGNISNEAFLNGQPISQAEAKEIFQGFFDAEAFSVSND